ncbi:MAG: hypothetical protein AAGE80_18340 [Pseudomonadota bacterium]
MMHARDVVFIRSNRTPGFRTIGEQLGVLNIWQAGGLRQTSTFERPAT